MRCLPVGLCEPRFPARSRRGLSQELGCIGTRRAYRSRPAKVALYALTEHTGLSHRAAQVRRMSYNARPSAGLYTVADLSRNSYTGIRFRLAGCGAALEVWFSRRGLAAAIRCGRIVLSKQGAHCSARR
jgi:hypothetical protein